MLISGLTVHRFLFNSFVDLLIYYNVLIINIQNVMEDNGRTKNVLTLISIIAEGFKGHNS